MPDNEPPQEYIVRLELLTDDGPVTTYEDTVVMHRELADHLLADTWSKYEVYELEYRHMEYMVQRLQGERRRFLCYECYMASVQQATSIGNLIHWCAKPSVCDCVADKHRPTD